MARSSEPLKIDEGTRNETLVLPPVSAYLARIGAAGGKKGGKARSKAKAAAAKRNARRPRRGKGLTK